jgi:hypothetical protein
LVPATENEASARRANSDIRCKAFSLPFQILDNAALRCSRATASLPTAVSPRPKGEVNRGIADHAAAQNSLRHKFLNLNAEHQPFTRVLE